MLVGLTGGIGSGKSKAATYFAELNINIIDTDILAREAVAKGAEALEKIAKHFGRSILEADGNLNRRLLREIIFSNPFEKRWLESLLHPIIQTRILRLLSELEGPYSILMSPLLLETEQKNLVHRILVIDIEEDTQVTRTLQRDGGNSETIKGIIASQLNRETRLSFADDIINNEGSPELLRDLVYEQHLRYLEHLEGSAVAGSKEND
tara:strand:- start:2257 stop:2880 length:624 start_codon:yes stop_codon:yes gene_type:complete